MEVWHKELPLFDKPVNQLVARKARTHNESLRMRETALRMLRSGQRISEKFWKDLHPGSRVAPTIEQLRNAHGFAINGSGGEADPYWMRDVTQLPTLVAVSDEIKSAYYDSQHWKNLRDSRIQIDQNSCVLCVGCVPGEQVHHVIYRLFEEQLCDLMTVCIPCHEKLHADSRLKFPSGMKVEHVRKLGFVVEFESWLLPKGGGQW